MKVKFNNSTLVFQKSLALLDSVKMVSVIGSYTTGVLQSVSSKSMVAFDVRNCSKIVIDGVKIRTSEIGYFYNGPVSDTDLTFPQGEPQVLTDWKANHALLQCVPSTPYVNDDVIQNVEIPVYQGATLFIVWYKSANSDTDTDTVSAYKKE